MSIQRLDQCPMILVNPQASMAASMVKVINIPKLPLLQAHQA